MSPSMRSAQHRAEQVVKEILKLDAEGIVQKTLPWVAPNMAQKWQALIQDSEAESRLRRENPVRVFELVLKPTLIAMHLLLEHEPEYAYDSICNAQLPEPTLHVNYYAKIVALVRAYSINGDAFAKYVETEKDKLQQELDDEMFNPH